MKRIVIVYGGQSVESEISILTALKVYKEFKMVNSDAYLIYLDHQGNFYSGKGLIQLENYQLKEKFKKINFGKDNKGYYFLDKFKKTYFDLVLILGHGKNAEDGTISSYFETLNIPYAYDDLSNVSLLQDKVKTKLVFKALDIAQTKFNFIHLHQFENNNYQIKLNYPIILKPSRLGSSIGINKVNNKEELINKLTESFRYDETILIEEYIEEKKEYNIALIGYENQIIVSDIEEVNDDKEILSFYDKYDYTQKNEKRIIRPQIEQVIKDEIIQVSKKIFSILNLCGIYRFDYIFDTKEKCVYLNEINSLPGSLAYYLFEEKGIKFADLVLMDIDFFTKKNRRRKMLLDTFQEGFVNGVDLDKLKK